MNSPVKILLVEDEENFGSLLKNYLELSKYEVTWAKNGTEAYSIFMQNQFNLCILDVMMPFMDGFTLAEKIKSKSDTPFFFLTAKNSKSDILNGYKIGADDYLTKPFDIEILLLKISAILNRKQTNNPEKKSKSEYIFGEFSFTTNNRLLQFEQNDSIKLSPKEALLLELLCQYKNTIMPREIALNSIWKDNNYFTKRSMDVYITKLRKHLSMDSNISIETFHQIGFQLNETIGKKQ